MQWNIIQSEKRSEVLTCATPWVNLGNVMLNGKKKSHKGPHIISFHLYEVSRIGKSIETASTMVVVWGWKVGRKQGKLPAGTRRSVFGHATQVRDLSSL